jgi:hypothetical protein
VFKLDLILCSFQKSDAKYQGKFSYQYFAYIQGNIVAHAESFSAHFGVQCKAHVPAKAQQQINNRQNITERGKVQKMQKLKKKNVTWTHLQRFNNIDHQTRKQPKDCMCNYAGHQGSRCCPYLPLFHIAPVHSSRC